MPADHGVKPSDHGVKPADHGVKPSDHGVKPADHGVKPTEATEEKKKEQEKLGKEEKRPKAKKERKTKQTKTKTASHPPYFQMIKEALLALNEKSGSSPYAIAKYMEEKHKAVLPANFKKILGLQLKNSASRGKLIKIKASYKLSETVKKEKGTKLKVIKPDKTGKKGTRPRTRSVNKTETVKKGPTKVGGKKMKKSASAKPKQPKSIKSPGAKRTKRVSAA